MKNILALDTGTKTGWARLYEDGRIESGTEELPSGPPNRRGLRWAALYALLAKHDDVELIVYEDSKFVMVRKGRPQAISVMDRGGMYAIIQFYAHLSSVTLLPLNGATLKKYFAKHGKADKGTMIATVEARMGIKAGSDNEADALALLHYARAQEMSNAVP